MFYHISLWSCCHTLLFVGNITLLTYTHNFFCSSVYVCYTGVAVCGYGLGYVTGLLITYVYIVGCILFFGWVVFYVSGLDPPYYSINYCFYLIFAFGANNLLIVFPYVTNYVWVALMVWRATYNSICLVSMSSADSFVSASANTIISLPLVVVWGLMTSATFYMVALLVEGFSTGGVYVLSDVGVGFTYVTAFICAGCGAIPCCVPTC